MSTWRRAPVYVETHDLCRWLLERQSHGAGFLLPRLCDEALELLGTLAAALTFPAERSLTLHQADRRVVRLRVFTRLAAEAGALRPTGARYVASVLDRIGRMIGGWSRSLHHPQPPATRPTGDTL
jgi:hypothetical protein